MCDKPLRSQGSSEGAPKAREARATEGGRANPPRKLQKFFSLFFSQKWCTCFHDGAPVRDSAVLIESLLKFH